MTARHAYLLLTLALAIFAVAPLAYPGYLQLHSGFVPVYNLADLAGRPLTAHWTPAVATAFDPLRGDGLLAYYLGVPLVWLGATAATGVKVVFALGWILGAAGVFLWLRGSLGPPGACLAALVYTYLPYRIATVYVRGAWGEALCLGLIPIGMAVALVGREGSPSLRRLAPCGLAWLLVGLSQPGLAIWAWLCLAGWLLLTGVRRERLWTGLVAGAGVASAVVHTLWVAGWQLAQGYVNFHEHFLYASQLLSAYWGFGASRPGWNDGLSLSLGLAAAGLTALTVLLLLQRMGNARPPKCSGALAEHQPKSGLVAPGFSLRAPLVVALVLILLLFPVSAFFWRLSGLEHLLTYPWQLLGLAGLCLSVVAGASIRLERRLSSMPAQAALIIITLLASYAYLQPRFVQFEPGSAPRAGWNHYQVMAMDIRTEVRIPPAAAGLSEPTPGRLPLADYGQPRPGDTLHLLVAWQATRPFDHDLKMFVHMLDQSEHVVSQADPLAGATADPGIPGADYPTSRWDPGRFITTDVPLSIPPDAPAAPYHIAFGLYNGETLERLPVDGVDGGRFVVDVTGKEWTP